MVNATFVILMTLICYYRPHGLFWIQLISRKLKIFMFGYLEENAVV